MASTQFSPTQTTPSQPQQEPAHCAHCGSAFKPHTPDQSYCCDGCAYVHQIIAQQSWDHFYALKGQTPIPPVGSKVFEDRDIAWFEALIETSEAAGTTISTARCRLTGISCMGCIWLIEQVFRDQPGALDIHIQAQTGDIELSWETGQLDPRALATAITNIGYSLAPAAAGGERKRSDAGLLTTRIGVCGFLLMNTMLFTLPSYLGMEEDFQFAPLFSLLSAVFATCSLAVGGSLFIARALNGLRHRILHMDAPIASGLTAAYLGSLVGWLAGYEDLVYFDFVATFVFLMLVGRWLQEAAIERNQSHLRQRDVRPESVLSGDPVESEAGRERIAAEAIEMDQTYLLEPGARNPVAADLLESDATVSLEWINGEAEPIAWSRRTPLPAGAQLVSMEPVRLRAKEDWESSVLARLLASERSDFKHRRLQRVLSVYIGVVLVLALGASSAWWLAGAGLLTGFQVGLSILVVSCPCALGVALPFVDELASTALRRCGVFIKTHGIWEKLSRVDTVVFDKTGTLSLELPLLKEPGRIGTLAEADREALFQLVRQNPHPTARSIKQALLSSYPDLQTGDALSQVEEVLSLGVWTRIAEAGVYSLGRPKWAPFHEIDPRVADPGAHVVFRKNGRKLAAFSFAECLRDDARSAIDALKSSGRSVALLSGDAPERVDATAESLGINPCDAYARCTPDSKADWIRTHAPYSAMMIGDGANDRLAIDSAVCTGTPAIDRSILESSADFFFFGRSLEGIPRLFRFGRMRDRTSAWILGVAIVYNLLAVSACAAGWMHPLVAAIAMPVSSLATLTIAWFGMQPGGSHRAEL